jgi:hypothetical protein
MYLCQHEIAKVQYESFAIPFTARLSHLDKFIRICRRGLEIVKKLFSGGLLAAGLIFSVPAGASATPPPDQLPDSPVGCTFYLGMDFSGPLGGTVRAAGTFDCTGETIQGHEVTGPGAYSIAGDYTGACAAGLIDGDYKLVVPTTRGPLRLSDAFSIQWGPFGGHLSQEMGDKSYDGALAGVPTTGGPCLGGRADIAGVGVLH